MKIKYIHSQYAIDKIVERANTITEDNIVRTNYGSTEDEIEKAFWEDYYNAVKRCEENESNKDKSY